MRESEKLETPTIPVVLPEGRALTAVERFDEVMRRFDAARTPIPEAKMEELLDEAMRSVRPSFVRIK